MKLEKVHVTNFRSTEDSDEFTVGDVTCLVGKNEAGKSAILLALAALNPHAATPATFDKERDYPRRSLTQYADKHPVDQATAIRTTWRLNTSEMEKLATAVGAKVVASELVSISRRYGDDLVKVEVDMDFKLALDFLYSKFALDAPEPSVLAASGTTSEVIDALGKLASPTPKHQQLSDYLKKHGTVTSQVHKIIRDLLPKFMYFSSYDRMDGAIQLEHTQQLIANGELQHEQFRGARLFVEFLQYAGVSIQDILSVSTFETFNAKLKGASNNITDQVLEYWTQNPDLSVLVSVSQARPGDPSPLNSGTIARAHRQQSSPRRYTLLGTQRGVRLVLLVSREVCASQRRSLAGRFAARRAGSDTSWQGARRTLAILQGETGSVSPDRLLDTFTVHGASR